MITSAMAALTVFLKDKIFGKMTLLLFLLTLPLSIRKVFFVISPEGTSGFNEYTDVSLYLSDVTLLLFVGFFILENKNRILSILWWKQLFHVEHFKILFFAPLPFLLWSSLSIFWSKSHLLGVYSFSRLIEGYLLYVFLILYFVPRGTNVNKNEERSTWNNWHIIFFTLIISGFIQSIVAILQFTSQASLGLSFFKESILSPGGTGVAKIILAQESLIRAYGLFPHPNVLGGFLGITILFTIAYPLIMSRKMFHVEHSPFLYRLVLGIQVIGFLLTFSKGAFLGLFLAVSYFIYKMFHVEHSKISFIGSEKNVPRGTIQGPFHWIRKKCSTWNILKVVVIMASSGLFLGMVNWQYFLNQPLRERLFLEQGSFLILNQSPIQGVGIGQSVFGMQDFFSEKLLPWQFQPVHSLPLLILSETGLIGLSLFLGFLVVVIVPRGTIKNQKTSILFEAIGVFLFVTSLFDHYLWDIQQGQLLFWFMIGCFAATRFSLRDIDK